MIAHEFEDPDGGLSEVALHDLTSGPGPTLLAPYALGGSACDFAPLAALWPACVRALDRPGDGDSPWPRGGSCTRELHTVAVDDALAETCEAYLVRAGLGAYVAFLPEGARSRWVHNAWLRPGRGLEAVRRAAAAERAPLDSLASSIAGISTSQLRQGHRTPLQRESIGARETTVMHRQSRRIARSEQCGPRRDRACLGHLWRSWR